MNEKSLDLYIDIESLKNFLENEIEISKNTIKTQPHQMTPYAAGRLSIAAEILHQLKLRK